MGQSTSETCQSVSSFSLQRNYALTFLAEADENSTPLAAWHSLAVLDRQSVGTASSSSLLDVWMRRLRSGGTMSASPDLLLDEPERNQVDSVNTASALSVECSKMISPSAGHTSTYAKTLTVPGLDVRNHNHPPTTASLLSTDIQLKEPAIQPDKNLNLTDKARHLPRPFSCSSLPQEISKVLPSSSFTLTVDRSPNIQHQTLNSPSQQKQSESPEPVFSKSCSRLHYSPEKLLRLRHNRLYALPEGDPIALNTTTGSKLPILSFDPSETLTSDVLLSGSNAGLTFNDLGLPPAIVSVLSSAGFIRPSPVQLRTIPRARLGGDIIAHAKSGTGKTLAYVLATLDAHANGDVSVCGPPRTLVMVPTRELAIQVAELFSLVSSRLTPLFSVATFVGGTNERIDARLLAKDSPAVVVGTPGRIRALATSAVLPLHAITVLVLDEGDRLLESAFVDDIRVICDLIPTAHQTLAFSATFPSWLRRALFDIMRNPTYITIEDPNVEKLDKLDVTDSNFKDDINNVQKAILLGVRQDKVATENRDSSSALPSRLSVKVELLIHLLRTQKYTLCIVFVSNRKSVSVVEERLKKALLSCLGICASVKQSVRTNTMAAVREGKVQVLVATDLLARGVDLPTCDLVIHLDIPAEIATYLHRVGRAGRFGGQGRSIIIYDVGQEADSITFLEQKLGYSINTVKSLNQSDFSTNNAHSREKLPLQMSCGPDEMKLKKKGHTNAEDGNLNIQYPIESTDKITIKKTETKPENPPETTTGDMGMCFDTIGCDKRSKSYRSGTDSPDASKFCLDDKINLSQLKSARSRKTTSINQSIEVEGKSKLHDTTRNNVLESAYSGQELYRTLQAEPVTHHHERGIKENCRTVDVDNSTGKIPLKKRRLENPVPTYSSHLTINDRNRDHGSIHWMGSTVPHGLSSGDKEAWNKYAQEARRQGYNDGYSRAFRIATELRTRFSSD